MIILPTVLSDTIGLIKQCACTPCRIQSRAWAMAHADGAAGESLEVSRHRQVLVLTPTEEQILVDLAHGLSNHEVADHLGYAFSTIKNYLTVLYPKLNVRDRVGAVVLAYQLGLVEEFKVPEHAEGDGDEPEERLKESDEARGLEPIELESETPS